MSIPQINNGKRPSDRLNANQIWPLPANTPLGNLALKAIKIIRRIDHINSRIEEAYQQFNNPKDVAQHLFVCEEVVHWLRVTADELTMLGQYLSDANRLGKFQECVQLDSIGKLIGQSAANNQFAKHVKDAIPFLKSLNDISNAHKHSFINSDVSRIGIDEPGVFALHLPYNNLSRDYKLYEVKLSIVVLEFSAFFELCRDFILAENERLPRELRTSPGAAHK